ncbi:MAG: hypothetical protein IPN90_04265 [Elusimicrobia bacterium]|nr:hypothetical protein [Elusimicrobiota bacterium]
MTLTRGDDGFYRLKGGENLDVKIQNPDGSSGTGSLMGYGLDGGVRFNVGADGETSVSGKADLLVNDRLLLAKGGTAGGGEGKSEEVNTKVQITDQNYGHLVAKGLITLVDGRPNLTGDGAQISVAEGVLDVKIGNHTLSDGAQIEVANGRFVNLSGVGTVDMNVGHSKVHVIYEGSRNVDGKNLVINDFQLRKGDSLPGDVKARVTGETAFVLGGKDSVSIKLPSSMEGSSLLKEGTAQKFVGKVTDLQTKANHIGAVGGLNASMSLAESGGMVFSASGKTAKGDEVVVKDWESFKKGTLYVTDGKQLLALDVNDRRVVKDELGLVNSHIQGSSIVNGLDFRVLSDNGQRLTIQFNGTRADGKTAHFEGAARGDWGSIVRAVSLGGRVESISIGGEDVSANTLQGVNAGLAKDGAQRVDRVGAHGDNVSVVAVNKASRMVLVNVDVMKAEGYSATMGKDGFSTSVTGFRFAENKPVEIAINAVRPEEANTWSVKAQNKSGATVSMSIDKVVKEVTTSEGDKDLVALLLKGKPEGADSVLISNLGILNKAIGFVTAGQAGIGPIYTTKGNVEGLGLVDRNGQISNYYDQARDTFVSIHGRMATDSATIRKAEPGAAVAPAIADLTAGTRATPSLLALMGAMGVSKAVETQVVLSSAGQAAKLLTTHQFTEKGVVKSHEYEDMNVGETYSFMAHGLTVNVKLEGQGDGKGLGADKKEFLSFSLPDQQSNGDGGIGNITVKNGVAQATWAGGEGARGHSMTLPDGKKVQLGDDIVIEINRQTGELSPKVLGDVETGGKISTFQPNPALQKQDIKDSGKPIAPSSVKEEGAAKKDEGPSKFSSTGFEMGKPKEIMRDGVLIGTEIIFTAAPEIGKKASAAFLLSWDAIGTQVPGEGYQALMFEKGSVHTAADDFLFQGTTINVGDKLGFGDNGKLDRVNGEIPSSPADLFNKGVNGVVSSAELKKMGSVAVSENRPVEKDLGNGTVATVTAKRGEGHDRDTVWLNVEVKFKTGETLSIPKVEGRFHSMMAGHKGIEHLQTDADLKTAYKDFGHGVASLSGVSFLGVPVTLTRVGGTWTMDESSRNNFLSNSPDFAKNLISKINSGDWQTRPVTLNSIRELTNFSMDIGSNGLFIDRVEIDGQADVTVGYWGKEFSSQGGHSGSGLSTKSVDVTWDEKKSVLGVNGKMVLDISGEQPRLIMNQAGVRINITDEATASVLGQNLFGATQYVVNEKGTLSSVGWDTFIERSALKIAGFAAATRALGESSGSFGPADLRSQFAQNVDPLLAGGMGMDITSGGLTPFLRPELTNFDRASVMVDALILLTAPIGLASAAKTLGMAGWEAMGTVGTRAAWGTFVKEAFMKEATGFASRLGAAHLNGMTFGAVSYGLDTVAGSIRNDKFTWADSTSFTSGYKTGFLFSAGVQGTGLVLSNSATLGRAAETISQAYGGWSKVGQYTAQMALGGVGMAGFSVLNGVMSGHAVGAKELGALFVTGFLTTGAFLAFRGGASLTTQGMSGKAMGSTLQTLAASPYAMPLMAVRGAASFALTGPAFGIVGGVVDLIPGVRDVRHFLLNKPGPEGLLSKGFNLMEAHTWRELAASSADMGKMGLWFAVAGAAVHGALPPVAGRDLKAIDRLINGAQTFVSHPARTAAQLALFETGAAAFGYVASEGIKGVGSLFAAGGFTETSQIIRGFALTDAQRAAFASEAAFGGLMAVPAFGRLSAENRAVKFLVSEGRAGRFSEHTEKGALTVPSLFGETFGKVGEFLFGKAQPVRLTDELVLKAGERVTGEKYDSESHWKTENLEQKGTRRRNDAGRRCAGGPEIPDGGCRQALFGHEGETGRRSF